MWKIHFLHYAQFPAFAFSLKDFYLRKNVYPNWFHSTYTTVRSFGVNELTAEVFFFQN